MSVVRHPHFGWSSSDSSDRTTQDNLIRLSDADRVRDEPCDVAFRSGPRDTSAIFVFETNLRGDLGSAQSSSDAIEQQAPRDDSTMVGFGRRADSRPTHDRDTQAFRACRERRSPTARTFPRTTSE